MIRLTVTPALVRHLMSQRTILDGMDLPLFRSVSRSWATLAWSPSPQSTLANWT